MPYLIRIITKENRFVVRNVKSTIKVLARAKRGLPGVGVPTGGTAGQVLSKESGADYDTHWVDPAAASLVESVNGKTGIVVIDAEDVGADTAGSASQALSDANEYTDEQIANLPPVVYPVTSVNGRTGAVTGLAEQALLDMVEEELYEDLTAGDAATLASAKSYTDNSSSQVYNSSKQEIITPLTIFSPGHGFTKITTPGTMSDDTSDNYKDGQCLSITTSGGGASGGITIRKSIDPIDFANRIPVVAVKVDETTNLSNIGFFFASNTSASNSYNTYLTVGSGQIKAGQWIPIALSLATSTIAGSPNLNSISTLQVRVVDSGQPVTVKLGLIGYMEEGYRAVCTLTFDDGRLSQYTNARSKMDEYGMPGTVYVNSATVGSNDIVSLEQLTEMQDKSGWDISGHSHDHIRLSDQTAAQVEYQLRSNKDWLMNNGFAKGANHFAYPHGSFDYTKVIPLVKKYFSSARSIIQYPEYLKPVNKYALKNTYVVQSTTLQSMKDSVTRAILNKEWALLTFHSVLENPVNSEDISIETFNSFIDWLSSQDIEVRTVSDVLQEESEYKGRIGLSEVDNTKDIDKPVSTAAQSALNLKANDNSVVKLTTNQTISGTKTYTGQQIFQNTATNGAVRLVQNANDSASGIRIVQQGGTNNFNLWNDGSNSRISGSSNDSTPVVINGLIATGTAGIGVNSPSVSNRSIATGAPIRIQGVDYITGTGFPNGVVSAPVGSIYIDTAVTNGASSWIKKSGTGNTGWQVLEGDTGWRNVTSLLIFGWAANQVLVRRIGNQVYWSIEALSTASITNIQAMVIPDGFRYSGVLYAARQFLTTATSPASVWRATMQDSVWNVQGATTTTGTLYGQMDYALVQAWPTTLPGTAA